MESIRPLSERFPEELGRSESLIDYEYCDVYVRQFIDGLDESFIEDNSTDATGHQSI